jgi:hypothetical protein
MGELSLMSHSARRKYSRWFGPRSSRLARDNQVALVRHDASAETGVERVSARFLTRSRNEIVLRYCATGDLSTVTVPRRVSGRRKDDLWRNTCFEFFARFENEPAYWEMNFSPSSDWAAYRFSDYRNNRRNEPLASAAFFDILTTENRLRVDIRLSLGALQSRSLRTARFGFSAVFRDAEERMSYWALAHPEGQPDFHHPTCFSFNPYRER